MSRSIMVHCDPGSYSSHPALVQLKNEWLIAFSSGPRRKDVVHPPDHPQFWNKVIRSSDRGQSWTDPQIVPGYDWHGVETPALTRLSTGEVLLNQWRFKWHPLETARHLIGTDSSICFWDKAAGDWRIATKVNDFDNHRFPYARADDGAYVHISDDSGRTWGRTHRIDPSPYIGAFSPHGGVQLDNGDIVLPLGSHSHCPKGASIVVRSSDRGKSWSAPIEAAAGAGEVFSEPSLTLTMDGQLVLMSREERSGFIYQSTSADLGVTWSPATRLGLWGFPASVTTLTDGSLCVIYGYRRHPGGVRLALSADGGRSWGEEIVIREDLPLSAGGWNLGYPQAIEYEPGRLFAVYYGEDSDGVTCIQGTFVDLATEC